MENPEIPGRIQMKRFVPEENFPEKKEYLSRYYLFPILTENFLTEEEDRNFLYHLFGLPVPGFMSRESEKFTGLL